MLCLRIIALSCLIWFATSEENDKIPRQQFLEKHDIPERAKKHFGKYSTKFASAYFEPFLRESLIHTFEARMRLQRGQEECYLEKCDSNQTILSLDFQSNTPSSFRSKGNLMAYIRALNGSVYPATEKPATEGNVTVTCSDIGLYEICLDNRDDRFSGKSVDIQINAFRGGMMLGYHIERKLMSNDSSYQLYDGMFQVAHAIVRFSLNVHSRKAHIARDYELTQSNKWMVTTFSLLSLVLVALVSYGQVYYLKKMFNLDGRPLIGNGTTRL